MRIVTFAGCKMLGFSVVLRDGEAETKIKMEASFVSACQALEWEPLPVIYARAGPSGAALEAVFMTLDPGPQLRGQYGFKLPCHEIGCFQVLSEGTQQRLRFTVATRAKQAWASLGNWLENIGQIEVVALIECREEQEKLNI